MSVPHTSANKRQTRLCIQVPHPHHLLLVRLLPLLLHDLQAYVCDFWFLIIFESRTSHQPEMAYTSCRTQAFFIVLFTLTNHKLSYLQVMNCHLLLGVPLWSQFISFLCCHPYQTVLRKVLIICCLIAWLFPIHAVAAVWAPVIAPSVAPSETSQPQSPVVLLSQSRCFQKLSRCLALSRHDAWRTVCMFLMSSMHTYMYACRCIYILYISCKMHTSKQLASRYGMIEVQL